MTRIYHFNPETLALVGEGQADESPLEPGVFLIPAGSTDVAPPADVPGTSRHFSAGAWEYRDIPPPPPEPVEPLPSDLERARVRAALDVVDKKSIRALREGDAARVATLEAQAAALRVELAALPK